MKVRFFSGLLCVGLSVSMASAQDLVPAATTGAKAILFSFSGLSNLGAGAYNGGIGGKYFLSNPLAIRGGLQFATAHLSIPAASDSGTDGSASATQLGIFGGAEYHLTMNRVSPYIGAVAGFSMTSTKSVSTVIPPLNMKTTIDNNEGGELNYHAGTALSLGGLGGVEFFLTKEISLSAEYQLGYSILNRPDQKITTVSGSTTVINKKKLGDIWTLGISNGGALTLAVYF